MLEEINQIHPNIKLTFNHTSNPDEAKEHQCDYEFKTSIPFLDTPCSVKNGRIYTVSVLVRDPLPEGVPEGKARGNF